MKVARARWRRARIHYLSVLKRRFVSAWRKERCHLCPCYIYPRYTPVMCTPVTCTHLLNVSHLSPLPLFLFFCMCHHHRCPLLPPPPPVRPFLIVTALIPLNKSTLPSFFMCLFICAPPPPSPSATMAVGTALIPLNESTLTLLICTFLFPPLSQCYDGRRH